MFYSPFGAILDMTLLDTILGHSLEGMDVLRFKDC